MLLYTRDDDALNGGYTVGGDDGVYGCLGMQFFVFILL